MPDTNVPLSPKLASKLLPHVSRYNANTGQALDLVAWVIFHLKEMAVQTDLTIAIKVIEQQKQDELQTAIATERARLIALL
jgi:hypothetical protein